MAAALGLLLVACVVVLGLQVALLSHGRVTFSDPVARDETDAGDSLPAEDDNNTAVRAATEQSPPVLGPTTIVLSRVVLDLAPGQQLLIEQLRGRMVAKTGVAVHLDRPDSYNLVVDVADLRVPHATLLAMARDAVRKIAAPSARPSAAPWVPMGANIQELTLNDDLVTVGGDVKVADLRVPFVVVAQLYATDEGAIRMDLKRVDLVGIEAVSLLEVFGIDVNQQLLPSGADGGRAGLPPSRLGFVVELATLMRQPHLQGRISAVHAEHGALRIVLGDASLLEAPGPNQLVFAGGAIRFGQMAMWNSRIELIDADPSDPLHLNLPHLQEALLISGAHSLTDGMRIDLVDYEDLKRP